MGMYLKIKIWKCFMSNFNPLTATHNLKLVKIQAKKLGGGGGTNFVV